MVKGSVSYSKSSIFFDNMCRKALDVYHLASFWIKVSSAFYIILTIVLLNLEHPMYPVFREYFIHVIIIGLFFGIWGYGSYKLKDYKLSKVNMQEKREFPDYIIELAQRMEVDPGHYSYTETYQGAWSTGEDFILGRIPWECLSKKERIALMAHEFAHKKHPYVLLKSLILMMLPLLASVILILDTPKPYLFAFLWCKFYLLGAVAHWIQEVHADLVSLEHTSVEIIRSEAYKWAPYRNRFAFTHPSINARLWFSYIISLTKLRIFSSI